MPKYFCDYCDTYLTHDSPSVRKTHCAGRKHKENVKAYYQKWMEDQAQNLIDVTTAAFKAGTMISQPPAPVLPPPPLQLVAAAPPSLLPPPPPQPLLHPQLHPQPPQPGFFHPMFHAPFRPPSMGYMVFRPQM